MTVSRALLLAATLLAGSAISALAAEVQTFQTSAGPVKITPIVHATLMLEAGGQHVYVDPAKPANLSGMPKADLILVTDIHGDHMDPATAATVTKTGTIIVAPAAVQKTMTSAKTLANGETTTIGAWKITAVPMYNLVHKQPSGAPYHDKGRGNGYVVSYGGKNFYFAGDTEGVPEMRALKNIDVAFIPMNLPYTMTPAEAAEAVKAFKPKVVIPYHYRGQDTAIFRQALEGTGIEVRLLDWYPK
jgi:L-ascorbate metabolism protein UlaG (beta-lactamase superfamily)